MSKPKAVQLEGISGLDPLAKDWIKALVSEAETRIIEKLTAQMSVPQKSTPVNPDGNLKERVDDLTTRFDYLERQYDESEKYSLTRSKVLALLKKEGL